MVPHAAESSRRLDKTAVLRFATHGLRLQYVFGKSASRRRKKTRPQGNGYVCLTCRRSTQSQSASNGHSNATAGLLLPHPNLQWPNRFGIHQRGAAIGSLSVRFVWPESTADHASR